MAVPWNQTPILAPSMRCPASSLTRPWTSASARSAVSRRKSSRRNSSSEGKRQLPPARHGTAHSGVRLVQKSTQVPGSLGSQREAGSASGSTSGDVGPRPSQKTQPSGRSTQRTSRASKGADEALGAVDRPRERRPPPPPGTPPAAPRASQGGAPAGGNALAFLCGAHRRAHLRGEIVPRLAAGVDVVTDRYVMSSLASQAEEADRDWVASLARALRPAD